MTSWVMYIEEYRVQTRNPYADSDIQPLRATCGIFLSQTIKESNFAIAFKPSTRTLSAYISREFPLPFKILDFSSFIYRTLRPSLESYEERGLVSGDCNEPANAVFIFPLSVSQHSFIPEQHDLIHREFFHLPEDV